MSSKSWKCCLAFAASILCGAGAAAAQSPADSFFVAGSASGAAPE